MTPKLNHWAVVNEAIANNHRERLNWKALLGMSLNRAVAKFKAQGYNAAQTLEALNISHPEWDSETRRRLKIGVCARFGEMETAQKELKK